MRSRTWCLLCLPLLLLCSPLLSADEYAGPALPSGWYPISEAELTALETTLTQQADSLTQARQELTVLRDTLLTQQATIERLRTSFEEYENAAEARARRERWTWGGAGLLLGVVVTVLIIR